MAVNGKQILTPAQPMFPMGAEAAITIERQGTQVESVLAIPRPRSRKQPYSEPQSVIYSKLTNSVGYIKVTILPGLIGIDVAKEIDDAFGSLKDCERLILDLRGHLGGGLGVLRLMSHLTPDRIPIGYTFTRQSAERRLHKEDLPSLDRIPSSKLFGIASLALRFGWRDPSVVLTSEGLGPKKCHGRIVILTNEGTVSAGEMVCAFARERHLATLVGMETAGRLIPGSGFKVGHGYLVIFPKAAYITWDGATFEGKGVSPNVEVPWSFEAYQQERDNQLERALEVVSAL